MPSQAKSGERQRDVDGVLDAVDAERRERVVERVERAQARTGTMEKNGSPTANADERVGDDGCVGGVERAALEQRDDDRAAPSAM